jgi:tetratricopeptide (TPR) repeat protein
LKQYETLVRENPAITKYRQALAYVYLRVARFKELDSDLDESESFIKLCIDAFERLKRDLGSDKSYNQALAAAHSSLARLSLAANRRSDAETSFKQVVALLEELVGKDEDSLLYRDLGLAYFQLANLEARNRGEAAAQKLYKKSSEVLSKAVGIHKQTAKDNRGAEQNDSAQTRLYATLSDVQIKLKDIVGARQSLELALNNAERLHALMPENNSWHDDIAWILGRMGLLERGHGDNSHARNFHERAVSICEEIIRSNKSAARSRIIWNLEQLVTLYSPGSEDELIETARQRIVDNYRVLHQRDPRHLNTKQNLVRSLEYLGDGRLERKKWDEAVRAYDDALALDPLWNGAHIGKVFVFVRSHQWRDAMHALEERQAIDPTNYFSQFQYSFLLLHQGLVDKYHEHRQRLLKDYQRATDPQIIRCIAKACVLSGGSEADIDQAVSLAQRVPSTDVANGWTSHIKGFALYRKGAFAEAKNELEQAARVSDDTFVTLHTECLLAMVEKRIGNPERAMQHLQRAKELQRTRTWDNESSWHDVILTDMLLEEAESS